VSAPDQVRAIADAVLYEGYILWPYRRSALKNQRRFTFGGVYPPAHTRAHADDPSAMRTEVLLECGPGAGLDVTVRFLQVVDRSVARRSASRLEPVDELTVGVERHMSWEEAVEREIRASGLPIDSLATGLRIPISIQEGSQQEPLLDERGRAAGALKRSWQALEGEVRIGCERASPAVAQVAVEVLNRTPFDGGSRQRALAHTFCSTHVLLHARRGSFVSLTDPPEGLREAADACRNEGAWPVLVGEPGSRSTMLCSPIILEDHPRIAPESPGDLFDGGEIDQLLILNILSLTDEEKAEMRATDPRAREILERTEALTPEELMRLHGTIREFGLER
jgi:hydrogenase maturation protease